MMLFFIVWCSRLILVGVGCLILMYFMWIWVMFFLVVEYVMFSCFVMVLSGSFVV